MDDEKELSGYLLSLRNTGAKLGLSRMRALLDALDNPQKGYTSIVVGGTSGKGSTTAMLSSILTEAGYKTGRLTSPHLSSLTERIALDGTNISIEELHEVVELIRNAIAEMSLEDGFEHPTFFEVITAAAFLYFAKKEVDFAVLEVGLGGRLDATNTAGHDISIITNVSLEHTKILGNTVAGIAGEKAGIITNAGYLITASGNPEALEVLEKTCQMKRAKMLRVGREITATQMESSIEGQRFNIRTLNAEYNGLSIPLMGKHQLENAACAVGAIHVLGLLGTEISEEAIREGLSQVKWPGRLEKMQEKPLVFLDCAKDHEAMKRLAETVGTISHQKLILVLGISSDKNIRAMVDTIVPRADSVIVTAHKVMDRAASTSSVAEHVRKHSKECLIFEDVKDAVKKAIGLAGENDLVLVTGSLFTVGEAREFWKKNTSDAQLGRELNEKPKK